MVNDDSPRKARPRAQILAPRAAPPKNAAGEVQNFVFALSWALWGGACAWALLAQPEWAKLALGDGFLASWGPEPLIAGFGLMAAAGCWGAARSAARVVKSSTRVRDVRKQGSNGLGNGLSQGNSAKQMAD